MNLKQHFFLQHFLWCFMVFRVEKLTITTGKVPQQTTLQKDDLAYHGKQSLLLTIQYSKTNQSDMSTVVLIVCF